MNEKYLPVGTVVRLKGGLKDLVVVGFCPISNDNGLMYDYCACLYPEGVISSEMNLLFNHEDIEQVLFKGFVSEEETDFKVKLNEIISQKLASGELPPKGKVSSNNEDNSVVHQPMQQLNNNAQPQMFSNNNNQ